ncbi:mannose-1-phosphate guanylyltransferase [Clostridium magnum]|uniref:mannose-1-phosphate guanylyltransferase n=1 Tax=Clostridium magnum DSM 2767 TaxID=1121326 RepID=A0A162RCP2_9CLOT|nr:mannose-1-phosphate guanylyltransferase [Clostridium magnum]KZL89717.1 mannose-1-phosphate guanylyltransferase RfbM [Clostridium magnum DSM 2767]SHH64711.1 mannose-1-phosphate guanylyltransferase (GDP) [Clostridium magnum DSM 2767]
MLCALIMAGGKGERFWPLSTDEKPKQFLNLLGNETMIQMTVKRLEELIPIERVFVVTAKRYVELVREQLPNLPERNIIVEPVGKNTAPCIALSAFIINKCYGDASIVVLPSDHLIVDENKFRKTIDMANEFVENCDSAIVTLGMRPDRPETGYGYIKYSEIEKTLDEFEIRKVDKFEEKPDLDKAKRYLSEGNFLWNGGMFVWKCSTVLNLTKEYLCNTYEVLSEIAAASEEEFNKVLESKYHQVDSVSVDYGIMEKAKNIYVIPADFGWDDIGTWYSVERYREKDDNNNVCVGDIKNIEGSNNIVVSKEKPIVVVGLDDVFVVESDDIIFVGKKEDIERIKEIKKKVC